MDYRQLQLFLATAERLNLSHAAEAMNITQPGLSKSMHRLQRELGTRLYHRRGRGIELTESGRALLRHVKLIETQLADARSEVIGHRRRQARACPHRRRTLLAQPPSARRRSLA